jgi:hypothetical protein
MNQVKQFAPINAANEHYDLLNKTTYGLTWSFDLASKWSIALSSRDADLPARLSALNGKTDTYLAVNQFNGKRCILNLSALNTCFTDIDLPNITPDGVRQFIDDAMLPPASLIVMSGRGAHAYWVFPEAEKKGRQPLWRAIQESINTKLNAVGCPADRKAMDPARVLRVVGSINSKVNTTVVGYPTDYRWTLDELAEWVDAEPPVPRITPGQVRSLSVARADRRMPSVGMSRHIGNRWHLVIGDLKALLDECRGKMPVGYRNEWLFIYAVAVSWFADADNLQSDLLNAIQSCGLNEADALASVQSVISRAVADKALLPDENGLFAPASRYKFKRQTLWARFEPLVQSLALAKGVTISNMVDLMDLRAIVPEGTRHARRLERQATKRDCQARADYLASFENSAEKVQPWIALNISRATFYRRQAATLTAPSQIPLDLNA